MKKKMIAILAIICIAGCSNTGKDVKDAPRVVKITNKITKDRIEYQPNINHLFLNSSEEARVLIKLKADDAEKVTFVYYDGIEKPNGKDEEKRKEMRSSGSIDDKELFFLDIKVPKDGIRYYFEIVNGTYTYYYGEQGGNVDKSKMVMYNYRLDATTVPTVPEWVSKATFYQIVVDRYRNGNVDNDPIYNALGANRFTATSAAITSGAIKSSLTYPERWGKEDKKTGVFGEFSTNSFTSNWESLSNWEKRYKEENKWYNKFFRHYGGDLKGIEEKLDYLKEKGIDAIILSPVFYSNSFLKNDSNDMRHIDPSFGTIEESGTSAAIEVAVDNSYGKKYYSEKGKSELILLDAQKASKEYTNMLEEREESYSWNWTESDIIFSSFVKKAHKKGIRVIIDVEINFSGNDCWAFQKAIVEGPKSAYANWYVFTDWKKVNNYDEPLNLDMWNPVIEYAGNALFGVFEKDGKKWRRKWVETLDTMTDEEKWEIFNWNRDNLDYKVWHQNRLYPKVNLDNYDYQKYVINSLKKWAFGPDGKATELENDDGIDGIKLLSLGEVDRKDFAARIRYELTKNKKDFLVAGELSSEVKRGIDQKFCDTITNYYSMVHAVKFFINNDQRNKIRPQDLKGGEMSYINSFPTPTAKGFLNYIDSQDTDRAFSMGINGDREYDAQNKIQDNDKYMDIRPDLFDENGVVNFKILSALQLMNIGAPVIYYGDEIGMWGADDPYSTKPMIWEDIKGYEKESDTLDKYKDKKDKLKKDAVVDEANALIRYDYAINEDIEEWYNKILKIRKEEKKLFSDGELDYILMDEAKSYIAIERYTSDRSFILLVNNGSAEGEVILPIKHIKWGSYKDIITGDDYGIIDEKIKIKMKKKSVIALYFK